MSNLILALKFSAELENNPHLLSEIKKHEIVIEDVEFDTNTKKEPKKKNKGLFANSLLSRRSTLSNRSYEPLENTTKPDEPPENTTKPDEQPNEEKENTAEETAG